MNTKLTSGLFGFIALLMASQANAATVQISPANETIIVGGSFELTIQGIDFALTNGGGFTLTWDANSLHLDSTELQIQTELFNNGLGGNSVFITQGLLDVIRVVSPTVPLSGNFNLTTLIFTAASPPGVTEISFIAPPASAWVDENNVELAPALQPNYVGASITITTPEGVVPVPSAVWLFGSGLIGLVGVARRKRA